VDTTSRTRPEGSWFGAPGPDDVTFSAEALAEAVGITRAAVERLVALDLIETVTPGSDRFSAMTAARVRRMVRLNVSLGVNLMGAAIIVDLLDRLDRMESLARRGRMP